MKCAKCGNDGGFMKLPTCECRATSEEVAAAFRANGLPPPTDNNADDSAAQNEVDK